MTVSWDKTDDRIWFGKWNNDHTIIPLYLVIEQLPHSRGWDWAVWQSDKPMVLRRGIASSALEAATAAEVAATPWPFA
jgi:hypothetical protein